jgi:hypothetical protein
MQRSLLSQTRVDPRLTLAIGVLSSLLSACGDGNGDSPKEGKTEAVDFSNYGWTECPSLSPEVNFDSSFAKIEGSYEMTFEQDECGVEGVTLTVGEVYTLNVLASPHRFTFEHDDGSITIDADDKTTHACEGGSSSAYEIRDSTVFARFVTFLEEPELFLFGTCSAEFISP